MKSMPLIQKYMTSMPHTIGADQTIKTAKKMMSEYGIRHLPVLKGSELVGLLSDRDVSLAGNFEGSADTKVDDVMMTMTYSVKPDAPLNHVASEMAERKYGSAIVKQENGKIVGIFTAVDALRVLSDVLTEHYRPT